METIFIEELVKKKKTPADYLAVLCVLVSGAILVTFLLTVGLPLGLMYGSITGTLALLFVAAVFYGVYYFLQTVDVEYEYSLVNAEIDIDKIMGKKRRKRMVTVYLRNLEDFGTRKNPEFNRYMENGEIKKVYACRDKNAEDVFFTVYDEGSTRIMLIFNPNEKIIDQIAKRNPRKVLI